MLQNLAANPNALLHSTPPHPILLLRSLHPTRLNLPPPPLSRAQLVSQQPSPPERLCYATTAAPKPVTVAQSQAFPVHNPLAAHTNRWNERPIPDALIARPRPRPPHDVLAASNFFLSSFLLACRMPQHLQWPPQQQMPPRRSPTIFSYLALSPLKYTTSAHSRSPVYSAPFPRPCRRPRP